MGCRLHCYSLWLGSLANLLLCGVDGEQVKARKMRAGSFGRNAGAKRWAILAAVLLTPLRRKWPDCSPPCRMWPTMPSSSDSMGPARRPMQTPP